MWPDWLGYFHWEFKFYKVCSTTTCSFGGKYWLPFVIEVPNLISHIFLGRLEVLESIRNLVVLMDCGLVNIKYTGSSHKYAPIFIWVTYFLVIMSLKFSVWFFKLHYNIMDHLSSCSSSSLSGPFPLLVEYG